MKIKTESTKHVKTQGFDTVGRLVLEASPDRPSDAEWLGVLAEFLSLGPAARPSLAEHMKAAIAGAHSGQAS